MNAPETMTAMPWITWLDLDTEFDGVGGMVARLDRPKPEHLNHNQAINAAVAYGVAEVAGAGAVTSAIGDEVFAAYIVIKEGGIAYAAPAREGLHASARVTPDVAAAARTALRAGQPVDVQVHVALTDPTGRPTGDCRFEVALRPRRTPAR
jgi:hypothetical protein